MILVIGLLVLIAWGAYSLVTAAQSALSYPGDQLAALLDTTPTFNDSSATIIHDVQSLAQLETIQYTVEKVITAEIGQNAFGFLFGDKMLFIAHGTVIAGIDMSKITDEDILVDGETLKVKLPEAEIFIATLDNDKSYVYDREKGWLTKGETTLETNARRVAEDAILEAALEDGILKQAQINAENYLYRFFISLGYKDVEFIDP